MLYLDYVKKMDNGYIMNFFADKEEDILTVSDGKPFVTNNGTNYGAPLESSTIVITMPDKTKKTYVLMGNGMWREESLGENNKTFDGGVGLPNQVINLLAAAQKGSSGHYAFIPYGKFGDYSDSNVFSEYPNEKKEILKSNNFRVARNMTTPEQMEGVVIRKFKNDNGLYLHTFYDLSSSPLCDEEGISEAALRALVSANKWPNEAISYVCKIIPGELAGSPFYCVVNSDCTNTFEELAYLCALDFFAEDKKLHAAENYNSLKFLYSYHVMGGSVAQVMFCLPPIIKDERINSMFHQVVEM